MRALTAPQKRLLDREGEGYIDVDELPREVFQELMRLNNHEGLITAINNYLLDKEIENAHVIKRW